MLTCLCPLHPLKKNQAVFQENIISHGQDNFKSEGHWYHKGFMLAFTTVKYQALMLAQETRSKSNAKLNQYPKFLMKGKK